MRDLEGSLTHSNPPKSFLLPPKKTHKQGFIKHPYPLPSTPPSSLIPQSKHSIILMFTQVNSIMKDSCKNVSFFIFYFLCIRLNVYCHSDPSILCKIHNYIEYWLSSLLSWSWCILNIFFFSEDVIKLAIMKSQLCWVKANF